MSAPRERRTRDVSAGGCGRAMRSGGSRGLGGTRRGFGGCPAVPGGARRGFDGAQLEPDADLAGLGGDSAVRTGGQTRTRQGSPGARRGLTGAQRGPDADSAGPGGDSAVLSGGPAGAQRGFGRAHRGPAGHGCRGGAGSPDRKKTDFPGSQSFSSILSTSLAAFAPAGAKERASDFPGDAHAGKRPLTG